MENEAVLSALNELTNRIIMLTRKIDAIADKVKNL